MLLMSSQRIMKKLHAKKREKVSEASLRLAPPPPPPSILMDGQTNDGQLGIGKALQPLGTAKLKCKT